MQRVAFVKEGPEASSEVPQHLSYWQPLTPFVPVDLMAFANAAT
jgi:hypothetical protein